MTHVIILDGTMSSLRPGCETNAGLAYKLLSRIGAPVSCYYEAGVQWCDWRSAGDVITGRGINRQIRRAYGYLASRYRPGDRIFLMGYSRGAFAVRSLAGVIDQVGLLRADCATERNVLTAYRHYQSPPGSPAARAFRQAYCHAWVEIEVVGVWDTVKALGLRLPILWRWSEPAHEFHTHQIGATVRHGFHALALDETRSAFAPVLWDTPEELEARVEQVWFPGAHGDVGGQLGGHAAARPLSNIPLVWMLDKLSRCGMPLPSGWQAEFPTDPSAPPVGTWMSWGKLFLLRKRRVVGRDRSERLHDSVGQRDMAVAEAKQVA
ncbi:DUF2235 domain-containing protein [Marimonas arenosa]|uniref:DUF2235 domain-containing protein n=2 Tax=Marimonas arenosa TaxID=1795305 RepID=A0AAE3WIB6_9RHOB|nr:DUF2235 domain-containing protein [Marimonas arenosa]MDQ2092357.1 DUF2235 domain-containing protein [Marimonas arenosa]